MQNTKYHEYLIPQIFVQDTKQNAVTLFKETGIQSMTSWLFARARKNLFCYIPRKKKRKKEIEAKREKERNEIWRSDKMDVETRGHLVYLAAGVLPRW